jgi:hypothetical protein
LIFHVVREKRIGRMYQGSAGNTRLITGNGSSFFFIP